jgi:hypothetical protein
MLLGVIGAAVLVVAALAVLTPTVIVDEGGRAGASRVRVAPAPNRLAPSRPRPGLPALPGARRFRDLRACLRGRGLGPPQPGPPGDLRKLRDGLKACRTPLHRP